MNKLKNSLKKHKDQMIRGGNVTFSKIHAYITIQEKKKKKNERRKERKKTCITLQILWPLLANYCWRYISDQSILYAITNLLSLPYPISYCLYALCSSIPPYSKPCHYTNCYNLSWSRECEQNLTINITKNFTNASQVWFNSTCSVNIEFLKTLPFSLLNSSITI